MSQTATDKLISPIVGKAVTTEFDLDARNDALETQAKRQRIITTSVGAEALNVIKVTFTVTAGDGTAITAPVSLKLGIYSDAVLDAVVAKTAFTLADGGAGALSSQAAAHAVYIFETTAAGLLEVNVTDVAGASGLTRHIKAELIAIAVPANTWAAPAVRQSVTFD
jgi:hypothetical protein